MSGDIPRAAGFGVDSNRKRPGLVDFGWAATHGSRSQRRAARKLIEKAAKAGNPDAIALRAELEGGASGHSLP